MNQPVVELKRANVIRLARVDLCASIESNADAARLILICHNGMPLRQVLLAIPRWGDLKTDRFIEDHNIGDFATLGGEYRGDRHPLTERQRQEIAGLLGLQMEIAA
jgi:hypothetical protein